MELFNFTNLYGIPKRSSCKTFKNAVKIRDKVWEEERWPIRKSLPNDVNADIEKDLIAPLNESITNKWIDGKIVYKDGVASVEWNAGEYTEALKAIADKINSIKSNLEQKLELQAQWKTVDIPSSTRIYEEIYPIANGTISNIYTDYAGALIVTVNHNINGALYTSQYVHLSAYGGSDEIRTSQMTMLFQDMKKEYDAGNYVLCGGDFNHDFTGNSTQMLNDMDDNAFGWAKPFPSELLPEGITRCIDYSSGETIATSRNCDIPYGPDCFTVILDGFLVSDNIKVSYLENQDLGFLYSDHNPVVMQFELVE